ncbi:MAG: outer membrane beta-barrel protein [Desulfobacterales bacterium]|nr:outer membrane beta-barrel protein [Desulfobacterales bacterium]
MKKIIFAIFVVLLPCISLGSEFVRSGHYIGGGLIYAYETFNYDDIYIPDRKINFDNAFGFDFKMGYRFEKSIAWEFSFDYIPDFKWQYKGLLSDEEVKLDIFSLYSSLKYSINTFTNFWPYVIGGIGITKASHEIDKGEYLFYSIASGYGPSVKGGLGTDYYLFEKLSIGAEIDYVKCFGNIRELSYLCFFVSTNFYF